jgi:hypothetical protein
MKRKETGTGEKPVIEIGILILLLAVIGGFSVLRFVGPIFKPKSGLEESLPAAKSPLNWMVGIADLFISDDVKNPRAGIDDHENGSERPVEDPGIAALFESEDSQRAPGQDR